MRINIKCSSAVHVLLMIAMMPHTEKVTSELLASSVGSNPVEIRKLLSSLKKAGIIEVVRGPGGASLKRDPKDITLLDIYSAVDSTPLEDLIGIHAHPAQGCPFGKNIGRVLADSYTQVSDAVRREMASITLEQLCDRLKAMEPRVASMAAPGGQ